MITRKIQDEKYYSWMFKSPAMLDIFQKTLGNEMEQITLSLFGYKYQAYTDRFVPEQV